VQIWGRRRSGGYKFNVATTDPRQGRRSRRPPRRRKLGLANATTEAERTGASRPPLEPAPPLCCAREEGADPWLTGLLKDTYASGRLPTCEWPRFHYGKTEHAQSTADPSPTARPPGWRTIRRTRRAEFPYQRPRARAIVPGADRGQGIPTTSRRLAVDDKGVLQCHAIGPLKADGGARVASTAPTCAQV